MFEGEDMHELRIRLMCEHMQRPEADCIEVKRHECRRKTDPESLLINAIDALNPNENGAMLNINLALLDRNLCKLSLQLLRAFHLFQKWTQCIDTKHNARLQSPHDNTQ